MNVRKVMGKIIALYDNSDDSNETDADCLIKQTFEKGFYTDNIHIKFRERIESLKIDVTFEERQFYFHFIHILNLICKQSLLAQPFNAGESNQSKRSQYFLLRKMERYLIDISSSLKKFRAKVTNIKIPHDKDDKNDEKAIAFFLEPAPHAALLGEIDTIICEVALCLGLIYERCGMIIQTGKDLADGITYLKITTYFFTQAIAHNNTAYAARLQDLPYDLYAHLMQSYSLLLDKVDNDTKRYYAEIIIRTKGDFNFTDLREIHRFDTEFLIFRAYTITNQVREARHHALSLLSGNQAHPIKKDQLKALNEFLALNGANNKKRKAPLTLFTSLSTASGMNNDAKSEMSLERLIDLTHLERLDFFLGENNTIKNKEQIIVEEMDKFKNNVLVHPFTTTFRVAEFSTELYAELHDMVTSFYATKFLTALTMLDNIFSNYVLFSEKENKPQEVVNNIKLTLAYFIERCIVLLIEQEGEKEDLININTYLFANDCCNQIQPGLKTTLFSMLNEAEDVFAIKSNPIALHSIINARLIVQMTDEQRKNYIHGVIETVKQSDALALSTPSP